MSNTTDQTRALYETLATTNGHPVISKFLADDCVWTNPLPAEVAFRGQHHGHAAIGKYFDLLADTIRIEKFEIERIVETDNGVAVHGSETSLVRATGLRYTMRWLHVVRITDQSVVSVDEYNDVPTMMCAFSPAESATEASHAKD